jgi:hypothetical protein
MAEGVRCNVKKSGQELLREVVLESETEKIGMARVGVFFVSRRVGGSQSEEQVPRGIFGKELFVGEIVAGELRDAALRAPTTLEKDRGGFFWSEGEQGIGVGKRREEGGDFGGIGGEGVPRITIAIVDDSAGAEDLLEAIGIFADDADDHVDEFGQKKGLSDDGTHADVAGLFVGVAERDVLR